MPETFTQALERRRHEQTPVMALRLDDRDELDDVVVEVPTMFRAEMMDDDCLWMACHFANGEQVVFHVTVHRDKPRGNARLLFSVTDCPRYEDWDALQRNLPDA